MNKLLISAFTEETAFIKEANLAAISNAGSKLLTGAGNALYRGWHGVDKATMLAAKAKGIRPKDATSWLGMKGLTVGLTATQLPDALKEQDPTGQGRSRTERLARLAGNTVGGIAGAGAVTRQFGPKGPGALKGLARFGANTAVQLGVGTAGVMGGEAIAAAPFKLMKKKQPAQPAPTSSDINMLGQNNSQPIYANNM